MKRKRKEHRRKEREQEGKGVEREGGGRREGRKEKGGKKRARRKRREGERGGGGGVMESTGNSDTVNQAALHVAEWKALLLTQRVVSASGVGQLDGDRLPALLSGQGPI